MFPPMAAMRICTSVAVQKFVEFGGPAPEWSRNGKSPAGRTAPRPRRGAPSGQVVFSAQIPYGRGGRNRGGGGKNADRYLMIWSVGFHVGNHTPFGAHGGCRFSDNRGLQGTPCCFYCTRRPAIGSREKLPDCSSLQPHSCQKKHGVFGQPAACPGCPGAGTL